jgi:hypothetical protein
VKGTSSYDWANSVHHEARILKVNEHHTLYTSGQTILTNMVLPFPSATETSIILEVTLIIQEADVSSRLFEVKDNVRCEFHHEFTLEKEHKYHLR